MARGQPDEETYQPRVSPEDLPRKVVPEMSGANFGGALTNVADTLDRKYQQDSATWAGDQIAQARVKAVTQLEQAKANAPPGDQTGFTDKYLASFDKDNAPLIQSAQGNPWASRMITKGITDLRDTLQTHTVGWEAQQNVAYRTDSFQQNLKSQLPIVETHPELADQVGSTLADQARAIGGGNEKVLPMLRQMHEQLSLAGANGMTRQNPQGMLDALASPEKAPANVRSVIDGLSDPQREAVMAKAKGQISSQFSDNIVQTYRQQGPAAGAAMLKQIDTSGQPADIKAQIYSGVEKGLGQYRAEARQTNAPALMGLEERLASGKPNPNDTSAVLDLYHKGVFSPEQAGEMRGRIEKAQEKQVDDMANFNTAHAAYTNGQGLDPKDKDSRAGVSQVFDALTKNVQPGSPEWINRAADISQKTGITPDSVVQWSRTALVSSSPQTAVQAANAIQRMQDANPRGTPYALGDDKETLAQAKLINDAVRAGSDPQTAVDNARKIAAMPDADKLRLDEIYRSNNSAFAKNTIGALTGELKADKRLQSPGFISNSALDIPNSMAGQYEELRKNYFKLTNGNIQQTNDLAFADLKNTWGITQVNGKREYMQFAPEQMNPGLTTDYLRKDMETSAKGLTPDPSKVRLIATPDTFQSSGQRWGIGVPDKFGAYSTLNDKRGIPIPYQLPTAAAAYQDTKAKLATEGMAKLHAMQQVDKDQAEWAAIKDQTYAERQ